MPVVPQFENDVSVAQPQGGPIADPNAFGKVGAAIAQGGAQMNQVETEWAHRYAEARRQADAADIVAKTNKAMGDLQFQYSKIPDHVQAMAGFNKDADTLQQQTYAGISDPLVLAYVKDRVDTDRVQYGLETQRQSFGLESSKYRGQVDQHEEQYKQQYTLAPQGPAGDGMRAKIVDDYNAEVKGAVAAGWLDPEEGEKHLESFHSGIQQATVEHLVAGAIDDQNGDHLLALARKVSDPTSFPGLNPDVRARLEDTLETKAWRLESRVQSERAHADAVADRNLAHAQAHNEATLLAGVNAGQPLSEVQIQHLADAGQISAGGVEALHNARDRAENGADDPQKSLHLWHSIDQNDAQISDVFDVFNKRQLSKQTATDMVKTIDAKNGRGDSALTKAAYGTLRTALSGAAAENGLLGKDTQAVGNWAAAQSEWARRVYQAGEDPNAVLSDMVPRYSKIFVPPTWLARPALGSIASTKDLHAIGAATYKAHQNHQISDAQYNAQVQLLGDYRIYYAEKDKRDAAAAQARAKAQAAAQSDDSDPHPGGGQQ